MSNVLLRDNVLFRSSRVCLEIPPNTAVNRLFKLDNLTTTANTRREEAAIEMLNTARVT